jgi:hypothetical protein
MFSHFYSRLSIATGISYGTLRYIMNDTPKQISSTRYDTITYRSPLSSATLSRSAE